MKTAWQTGLVALISLTQAGCSSTTTTPIIRPRMGQGVVKLQDAEKMELMPGNGLDNARIPYFTWYGKTVIVVWSDAPLCSSIGSSGNTIEGALVWGGKGTLVYRGTDGQLNREIAFSTEFQDAHEVQKGQFTINGESYDLTNGGLFLVSGADGNVQVKQLNRDVSELRLTPHDLVAFGQADPEINGFFSKASQPQQAADQP